MEKRQCTARPSLWSNILVNLNNDAEGKERVALQERSTSTAPCPPIPRTRRCIYRRSIRLQRVYRPSTQDQGVFIGVSFVLISILFELRAAIHLDDNAEDEGSVALQEPPSPDRCPILPTRDSISLDFGVSLEKRATQF